MARVFFQHKRNTPASGKPLGSGADVVVAASTDATASVELAILSGSINSGRKLNFNDIDQAIQEIRRKIKENKKLWEGA